MAFPFQQHQPLLYTKDNAPAGYDTKWEHLHPDAQKLLLQIEEQILGFKDESERLDQCSRLYESSASDASFETKASRSIQELRVFNNSIERGKVNMQEIMASANKMMRDTDFAVRSYMMLRQRFLRLRVPSTSNVACGSSNTGAVFYFYSGVQKRSSFFMEHKVAGFQEYLNECCQWIKEVEQLMMDSGRTSTSLEAIPEVISDVHDFFVHVAAKVENLHQYVESMKTAFLADRRQRGIGNDPFLEANRREAAEEEAAKQEDAARVHPTLHLSAISAQPSTQVPGAFVIPAASGLINAQSSAGTSAASSGGVVSLFSTPFSAPAPAPSSSFFLVTPTASAPSSTFFAASGFTSQSSPFGSPSASLLGSAQAPSGFTTRTPLDSNTPVGSSSVSRQFPSASPLGAARAPSRFTTSTPFGSIPPARSSSVSRQFPSASLFGSAQAPPGFTTSTPFGSTPPVGSSSASRQFPSASLFGSAQAPPGFTASPPFGSTPPVGSSSASCQFPSASLFGSAQAPPGFTTSTPFGSTPPVGSSSASRQFPSASLFGSAQAPSGFTTSTPFGSTPPVGRSSASPQFPSASLLGSAQFPSGFTRSTPFGSTPAVGSSSGFSTPVAGTGAGTASGASPGWSRSPMLRIRLKKR